jgi:predicted AAA+ superfamily ATPase
MYINRNLAPKINALLDMFPVVAILGARQTGKSTLAKQCRPDWKYVDLERPDDLEHLTRDPILYFNQYPDSIIIDEAQTTPQLFEVLRGVIDQDRQLKGRFILTGSSSPDLLSNISESLAGRIATVKLGTLKANEYYHKPLSKFYDIFLQKLDPAYLPLGRAPLSPDQIQHIWWKGGYPEPLLGADAHFNQWMEQYNDTYIYRDIARLFPKLNKHAYQRFLSILSKLSGTILNKSDIARTIEVNEKTIREYIHIIDGTFLWRQLPSFEKNAIKSIVKMPKGHLRDTGLLHYLLRFDSFDDLYNSTYIGHSFEAFAVEEIIKGLQATLATNWGQFYYRTRAGVEVDLILDGSFGTLPIEIKHSSYATTKHIKHLKAFIDERNLPFGIIINRSTEAQWVDKKIIQIPAGWL